MESVTRFWSHEAQNIRCIREADYDAALGQIAALEQSEKLAQETVTLALGTGLRVSREKEALQQRLTVQDQRVDELETQVHSLEQRRYAEQQAREAAERDAERYRWLRKVTPYRFKKIQDAAVTDGGDVMYFHADRFDNAVDAAMEPAINPTAEAESHVDCGSCRNITDGCKGKCQRSEEWSKP